MMHQKHTTNWAYFRDLIERYIAYVSSFVAILFYILTESFLLSAFSRHEMIVYTDLK